MGLKLTWLWVLLFGFFVSCQKQATEVPAPQVRLEAQTLFNVAYGNHFLQNMDVYLPANRNSNTSLIIFVHGGSFIAGDKSDFNAWAKELLAANFAVLNVNYRLVDATGLYDNPIKHQESAVKIKDQVADLAAIADYAMAKAKEWTISETKMAMAGHSAGATLALLYSYDALNANKIKAVANLAGSLDQTFLDIPSYQSLIPKVYLEAGYRYTGYEVGPSTELYYKAISPLYVANASQKVPTLNVFPELNSVGGLPKQDRATFDVFTAKLNSLGVPNKLVQVAGADHAFTMKTDIVLKEMIDYFNANLK